MHSGGGGGGGMSQKAHQGHFLRASHHPTISHHQQQQRALVRVDSERYYLVTSGERGWCYTDRLTPLVSSCRK